ncbi:hypothetical protein F4819DRAFT_450648 [Hypoxylon fuscum]|nr:hypothetical protein F4819DRAFT_450648 [Hypoxylon fuscum]
MKVSWAGLVGALASALAIPMDRFHQTSLPLPSRIISQMNETGSFIENIAIRHSGALLVTTLHPSASVYTVERPYSNSPSTALVHTFDDANGLGGISETSRNVFIVAAARFQGLATTYPNTTSIWELELSGRGAAARRIVRIPEALLLNGLVSVPTTCKPAVLVVDSRLGVVFRVDVTTGRYEVVLDVAELKPVETGPLYLGANGLDIRNGFLYWSNSELVSIYRIGIDRAGYPLLGAEVEKVATIEGAGAVDDFTFDEQGNIWAATNLDNTVVVIETDGRQTVVLGSPTELTVAGDTSVEFGKTAADKHILYVTTSGAVAFPINGTIIEPGKIVAVDTRGFY